MCERRFYCFKRNKMPKLFQSGYYYSHLLFFNSGKLGIFCSDANWEYRVIRGAIRLANTLTCTSSLSTSILSGKIASRVEIASRNIHLSERWCATPQLQLSQSRGVSLTYRFFRSQALLFTITNVVLPILKNLTVIKT